MVHPLEQVDPIRLAERIFELIRFGKKSSSYKHALLLAIIDQCAESAAEGGRPDRIAAIEVDALAVRVVELYWPQVRPFSLGRTAAIELRQVSGSENIVSAVSDFRAEARKSGIEILERARQRMPLQWRRLISRVGRRLLKQPIPKLQNLGLNSAPFLYGFDHLLSNTEPPSVDSNSRPYSLLTPDGLRALSGSPRRIILFPGVAEALVRIGGLIRPVVEADWTRVVGRMNPQVVVENSLSEHLFGEPSREAMRALVQPLAGIQGGQCFYCPRPLRLDAPADAKGDDTVEVDHFIPWAKHPSNALENLVLADRKCNASKRDFLPALKHVAKWIERLQGGRSELTQVGSSEGWWVGDGRAVGAAAAEYGRLADEGQIWTGRGALVTAATEKRAIGEILGSFK